MPRQLFVLLCLTTYMFEAQAAARLFSNDETLKITLTAQFKQLEKNRDKHAVYPGTLKIDDTEVPVVFNVRGNFRLKKETCRFSPLTVDFNKNKKLKGTPFHKQDDLKLVVQCKKGKTYLDYLRAEFLTYKALNVLTEISYGVRWAEVTYIDQTSGKETGIRSGFFVEKKKKVAKRNALKTVKGDVRISPQELMASQAALVDLFEYIIGNTDYSLVRSVDPTDCCHNAKLLKANDGLYVPIIYDFDNTGLVNASYAQVSDALPIRRVSSRLYRGYCVDREIMTEAKTLLLSHREQLMTLFSDDPILASRRKRTAQYLGKSLEIVADPKQYERKILKVCR